MVSKLAKNNNLIIIMIVLALLLACSILMADSAAAATGTIFDTGSDGLYVRSGPGSNYGAIDYLWDGDQDRLRLFCLCQS